MKNLLLVFALALAACTPKAPVGEATPTPKASATPEPRIMLSWESKKPELKATSDVITGFLPTSSLMKAKDIAKFCPKFDKLTDRQKVIALGEVIVATSYFESGWNPASASVDVGNAANKDTWSVGLMQMSVVDQPNYGFKLGYTYEDLKKPIPNMTLALKILDKQVAKRGVIAIPVGMSGLYWAVLHPGGKYDQTSAIAKRTQTNATFCN